MLLTYLLYLTNLSTTEYEEFGHNEEIQEGATIVMTEGIRHSVTKL